MKNIIFMSLLDLERFGNKSKYMGTLEVEDSNLSLSLSLSLIANSDNPRLVHVAHSLTGETMGLVVEPWKWLFSVTISMISLTNKPLNHQNTSQFIFVHHQYSRYFQSLQIEGFHPPIHQLNHTLLNTY